MKNVVINSSTIDIQLTVGDWQLFRDEPKVKAFACRLNKRLTT